MKKRKDILGSLMFVVLLYSIVSTASADTVLVEAESFEDLGGWVVDQQFMDQMGSPFLLAHGLGVPVKDAVTKVRFPSTGKYRIWMRTRDWVAPWKALGAPGRFQLLIDSKPLKTVFGTEGEKWHWQDGGTVEIKNMQAKIALRDLTGFEGRCDAVVFTTDPAFVPPNENPEMVEFRREILGLSRQPEDAGQYDLVVVGGGIAGTCTAVSAARLGVKVALVQDRPVLGGNNSSEVRVWLGGKTNYEPYPHIGDIVRELDPKTTECPAPAAAYGDNKKLGVVRAEKNIHLFLNKHVYKVVSWSSRILAVIAKDIRTGRELKFNAPLFADCTGDGTVGYLAGADFDITIKGHMGRTNLWRVVDTGKPAPFPRCRWAVDLTNKPFPDWLDKLGRWFWESGFYHEPFEKAEYIRDTNFRAMYGAWNYLKNVQNKYPNHKLEWAAYIAGKRESRRLLGDLVLTQEDLTSGRAYPDGLVPATWTIDLHLPDKQYEKTFEGDAFISKAHYTMYPKPYWIPYRCFYSRNISNLFMAGRDISVTHEALGAVRVMRTCGMMGEVVGMAASLCKKNNTGPRGVYHDHLDEFKELAKRGVGKSDIAKDKAFKQAMENGRLASEGFIRCRNFVKGWLKYADPATGLIPRNLSRNKDIWNAQDSAADNYPFMVLTAAITDLSLFEGRMLDMLRTETKLTSRIGALPDTYSFSKKNFQTAQPDISRIIFGSSEYIKDGLLPLTEWLGSSPWCDRMLAILDDVWKHAPIETKYGKIPSTSQEINGEMLQTLSRIYWMTGDKKYLDWAICLGDYYLLDEHHPTKDEERLSLDDHGCEIISGLCELYATVNFARPEKKTTYERPIHEMLDRVLEVGRDEHGLFYNWINPQTGDHAGDLTDNWGYDLNGFYTVYLIDKTEAYRQAVRYALGNLLQYYRDYKWEGGGADGYADSIEGAINLYNREPIRSVEDWLDYSTKLMWKIQKSDGVIEGWHGDGNFARTTIMYCLWKTKGLTIRPWREDVVFGAVQEGDVLKISIRAEKKWQGKILFDAPRHKTVMKMPLDWPRINQFPEWFTVEAEKSYTGHDLVSDSSQTLTGKQLHDGITIHLKASTERHILVE
jgi:hypothetical protein